MNVQRLVKTVLVSSGKALKSNQQHKHPQQLFLATSSIINHHTQKQQQQLSYATKVDYAKNVSERLKEQDTRSEPLKGAAETEQTNDAGTGDLYTESEYNEIRAGRGITTDQIGALDLESNAYQDKVFFSGDAQTANEDILASTRADLKRRNMTHEERDRIKSEMDTESYDRRQIQYSTEFRDTYQDETVDQKRGINRRKSTYANDRTHITGITPEQKIKSDARDAIDEDFVTMKEDIESGESSQPIFEQMSDETLIREKLRSVESSVRSAETEPMYERSVPQTQNRSRVKK